MRKNVLIILGLILSLGIIGCGKKQQSLEQMQEPISMEALSTMNVATAPSIPEAASGVSAQGPSGQLAALPTSGKPSAQEIQTALKNAKYYAGDIDGKLGPLTKKAIEDFQRANGLQADGKAGPKTWAVLSIYLNPVPVAETKRR